MAHFRDDVHCAGSCSGREQDIGKSTAGTSARFAAEGTVLFSHNTRLKANVWPYRVEAWLFILTLDFN